MQREKQNLREMASLLFNESKKYMFITYFIQALVFVINLGIIFFEPTNHNFIWIIFLVMTTLIIRNWFLVQKYKDLYNLGETIRKLRYKEFVLKETITPSEYSYIMMMVPVDIRTIANSKENNNNDFFYKEDSKYEIMIEQIQESCFFTSQLSEEYANYLLRIIYGFVIILAFLVVLAFLGLSSNANNEDLSKYLANSLALLINGIFTLNVFDNSKLLKSKAEELKKIDKELDNKKQEPNLEVVFWSFMEYNCALVDALPIPDFVYKKNRERLNEIWESRVVNINNDK